MEANRTVANVTTTVGTRSGGNRAAMGGRNDREDLYGGRGKGAMVAAWKCAARAEAVRLQKAEYAAVLLDLEKAFDRVPHHQVVAAARLWGYPLGVQKLS